MEPCNKPPKGPHVTGSGYLDVCPRHGIKHYASTPEPRAVPKKVMQALLELESIVLDECGSHVQGKLSIRTDDGVTHIVRLPWYS